MAALSSRVRLLRLEALVRVRAFGVWPWLALLGWGLFAAGQEPRLLRDFGIHISWQGLWSGATILVLALGASGAVLGSGATGSDGSARVLYLRYTAGVTAVLGIGLAIFGGMAQATAALLADAVTGQAAPPGLGLRSAVWFAIALAPASIACTCLAPLWGTSMRARFGLVAAVSFSLSLSAVCSRVPSASTVAASLLAAFGVACTSALIACPAFVIRTPARHANRHSR